MDWRALFLSPRGRISKRDFWIAFAMIMAASVALNLVKPVGQMLGLLLLWPQVCVNAKRLHDAGRTAWLLLIPAVVTLTCVAIALLTGGTVAETAFAVAAATGLVFLLWVGLSAADLEHNRFGPPPEAK